MAARYEFELEGCKGWLQFSGQRHRNAVVYLVLCCDQTRIYREQIILSSTWWRPTGAAVTQMHLEIHGDTTQIQASGVHSGEPLPNVRLGELSGCWSALFSYLEDHMCSPV